MAKTGDAPRDLSQLVVPRHGWLESTGDLFEPYRLVGRGGAVVAPVSAYFSELAACGTVRLNGVPPRRAARNAQLGRSLRGDPGRALAAVRPVRAGLHRRVLGGRRTLGRRPQTLPTSPSGSCGTRCTATRCPARTDFPCSTGPRPTA